MADYPKTALVLFEEAKKMNLKPQWLTDYGLFSIEINGQFGYVFYSRNMFNSNLSGFLAMDKHATRVVLEQNAMPNIPFGMFKTKKDVILFLDEHKRIIAKPVVGSSSKDVHLISSQHEIPDIVFEKYIFEKFIEGREMRYLVFQNSVIAVHEKVYEGPINDVEKVKRISYPKNTWNEKLVKLSIQITKLLFMKFAAVDYLIDKEGSMYVLEVNSSPGLYFFEHPTAGPTIPISRIFLEETIKEIELF
ncbi:MAG TPA: ATP-grasp domain-containing protein [Candidatus Saccharimonadales bacterium]|nr:ATP-grasp domain-containing protein [Candidatus Saccharimonadales bacterium]